MPDFGSAPVIESIGDLRATFIGAAGSRTTTIGSEYLKANVTKAELENWGARVGQLSNAGLVRLKGLGIVQEIAQANAIIADELHGIDRSLVLVFQKSDTLRVGRFKLPAPDASLFVGRYQMKALSDAIQGARLTLAVNAYLSIMNVDTPPVGTAWQFVNGYLDNAPSALRAIYPDDNNYIEPPAGSPSDDPGETPSV